MSTFLDRLDVQFGLLHDCIRGSVYGNYLFHKKDKKDARWAIMDMAYADAIGSWCMIFGAWSEPAHWKKFLDELPAPVPTEIGPFPRK